MRYAEARNRRYVQEYAYRIYDTDCSQSIAKNTSVNGGSYLNMRYLDIIRPKELIDAAAIVGDVVMRAGLEVI